MPRFEGRRALVTGGTRGIGEAIARRLLADGALVTVAGSSRESNPPDGCEYVAADLSDRSAVVRLADHIANTGFDILINNAGINRVSPFEAIADDDFDQIHQVNLRAAFSLCRAALPAMRKKGWGRIVNITSIWSHVTKEGRAAYAASKSGLDGMTASLAVEVAPHGILANCVAPGVIETELTRRVLGPAGIAEMTSKIPLGRLGRPDEVAAFVVWLASPENTFICGQNLLIDGGYSRI